MGWTGVHMSTPLSSGRYSFLSKNDIKIVKYTLWPSILSLFHPAFSGVAPTLGASPQISESYLTRPYGRFSNQLLLNTNSCEF